MLRSILLITVATAIVVLVFWLFFSQPARQPISEVAQAAAIPFTGFHQLLAPKGEVSYKVQLKGGPFEPSDPRWKEWDMFSKIDPNFEWKMPISFYGKVVDETGTPVSGAIANFLWNDFSLKGTDEAQVLSDSNGLFSLTGKKGKGMSVTVTKSGYDTPAGEKISSFEYANFSDKTFYEPDPDKPVIFHLRKKGVAEPLIARRDLYGFDIDGKPRYLNLKTGRTSPTPGQDDDLVVSFTRDDPSPHSRSKQWNATISVPNGGLIPSDQEFMVLAPESGYQKTVSINSENASVHTEQKFYLQSRNGALYGALSMKLYPDYDTGAAIDINYKINPAGSRNLEYDPTMTIKN